MNVCQHHGLSSIGVRILATVTLRMLWPKRNKEAHRYYLLPGMGRSNRRRHREFLWWSLVVGILVSAVFGYLLYLLSRVY
jgi:cytochrome b561